MSAGIVDLPWPACSPDMNVFENCWGSLALAVYEGGRHYYSIDDLKESITYHWENMPIGEVQALVGSMPRRVLALINSKGHPTKY